MLRVYSDVLAMQLDARSLCARIRKHDPGLASQLRRAAQSVALNMAEGMGARDGNRGKAYRIALGEARECMAAVEVAVRWGYIEREVPVLERWDKIVATLVRLTRPRAS